MKYIFIIITSLLFFNGCTFKQNYNKNDSIEMAQKRIVQIKNMVKDAETKNLNEIFIGNKFFDCSQNGIFGIENTMNNNLYGSSYTDFDNLIESNFLVHKRFFFQKPRYLDTGWVTSYIVGDGSIVISHTVNSYRGKPSVYCSKGYYQAYATEQIKIFSKDIIKEKNFFNKDITKVNKKMMQKFSAQLEEEEMKGNEKYTNHERYKKLQYEEREIEKYKREKAQYLRDLKIIKQKQEIYKREVAASKRDYYSNLNKRINNNIQSITKNNSYNLKSSSYTKNNTKKKDNIKVNYYTNRKNKSLPQGIFNSCGDNFTSMYSLAEQYRTECRNRYGNSQKKLAECFSQAQDKAKDVFIQKYGSWYGRKCSSETQIESPGKHDYEK